MAFLTRSGILCYDPGRRVIRRIPEPFESISGSDLYDRFQEAAGVYVDDRIVSLPEHVLILRPKSLAAGIGCNRNTPMEEIKTLLFNTLETHGLSPNSLYCLGTIDVKSDESGLLALAAHLNLHLEFYGQVITFQFRSSL